MFPVPRLANQLENEWAEELATRFRCSIQAIRESPTRIIAYPMATVRIELMDGSHVEFQNAFHIVSEPKRAIAVFTEHCGHHVFPYHEAKVFSDGKLAFQQKHV